MMQEFQPEENQNSQTALSVAQTPSVAQTQAGSAETESAQRDAIQSLRRIARRSRWNKFYESKSFSPVFTFFTSCPLAIAGVFLARPLITSLVDMSPSLFVLGILLLIGIPLIMMWRLGNKVKSTLVRRIPKYDFRTLGRRGGSAAVPVLMKIWKRYPAGEQRKEIESALSSRLAQMDAAETTWLMSKIAHDARAAKYRLRLWLIASSCIFALMGVFGFGASFSHAFFYKVLLVSYIISIFEAIIKPLKQTDSSVVKAETPAFEVEILTRNGTAAIPALLNVWTQQVDGDTRRTYANALTTLLPQMKISDPTLLTPVVRSQIKNLLTRRIGAANYGLQIAALRALEQVGDADFLPAVERLANRKVTTRMQKEIQQAAQDCLPALQSDRNEAEARGTLLRASQTEDIQPETLLRPASGAGQADAAELLRGTNATVAPE